MFFDNKGAGHPCCIACRSLYGRKANLGAVWTLHMSNHIRVFVTSWTNCAVTFKNVIVELKRNKAIRAGNFATMVYATYFSEFAAQWHSNEVLSSRINASGTVYNCEFAGLRQITVMERMYYYYYFYLLKLIDFQTIYKNRGCLEFETNDINPWDTPPLLRVSEVHNRSNTGVLPSPFLRTTRGC